MKPFPIHLNNAKKFTKLFDNINCILTDCDGVLFLQNFVIPGANTFLNNVRKHGIKVFFCTNNSSKTRAQIKKKLLDLGFEAEENEIMVTSYAAGLYLKKQNFNKKVYVFGSVGIEGEFKALGLNFTGIGPDRFHTSEQSVDFSKFELDPEVESVVLGFDSEISYSKLIRVCSYSKKVCKINSKLFIATNLDKTFPTQYAQLCVPGTGSLIKCITTAVGQEPINMGKPDKFFFECIKSIHPDINPEKCLMIGDRLDTDIMFAANNNLKYSLLVQSGVSSLDDVERSIKSGKDGLVPTHYCSSLGELNKFLD